ncbi:MAG TPA: hypothetical protein VFT43_01475, partial [Candidatus Polarisedimenticolia bacterium]|nr:hypothetical protein [Candidatus Polarisedimenticolia bacterium]
MITTNNGSYPWKESEAGREVESLRRSLRPGETPPDALRLALDRTTRETIDEQVHAGIDLVTDGLVRRDDPLALVASRLGGIVPGEMRRGFPGSGAAYVVPIVEAEVGWKMPIQSEDFLFASQGGAKPVKPVIPGPYTIARLAEDRAYGDPMALATGLAAALNQELRALQAAGATFIQVDEPALLQHKEDFPLFTRIWEVLGRGVSSVLSLHLEGGDIEGLYPGITRLKRLGCLSLDCVA